MTRQRFIVEFDAAACSDETDFAARTPDLRVRRSGCRAGISLGITGHGQNVPFTRFFLPAKVCAGFATSRSSPSTRSPERRVILSLYASRVPPQGAGDKRNYSPVSACFLDNSNHDIGCELSPGQSASKLARAALSSRFWRAVASATHAHELFATIS
jgi:hypothetical protein